MYKSIIRPILFLIDPEKVHHFTFSCIKALFKIPFVSSIVQKMYQVDDKKLERNLFGLTFKNPVGLAAGFDKNAVLFDELSHFEDYLLCFNDLFEHVDYFVVNVSSPNTPNLRELQDKEPLTKLLKLLQAENDKMAKFCPHGKTKPILLKIAPDLTNEQLLDIIDIVKETKIDGVIATNTTISRDGITSKNKNEVGGLSGKPVSKRSTEVIRFLAEKSNKSFPIIGVGGIHSADDALEKIEAGADLVQIYTGFIYEGPQLIKKINQALL